MLPKKIVLFIPSETARNRNLSYILPLASHKPILFELIIEQNTPHNGCTAHVGFDLLWFYTAQVYHYPQGLILGV